MNVEEFYNMTPRQFYNKREGFQKQLDYKTQLVWETTRWQAAVNIAPHTKKKISPKELAIFPWDNKKPQHTKKYKTQLKKYLASE